MSNYSHNNTVTHFSQKYPKYMQFRLHYIKGNIHKYTLYWLVVGSKSGQNYLLSVTDSNIDHTMFMFKAPFLHLPTYFRDNFLPPFLDKFIFSHGIESNILYSQRFHLYLKNSILKTNMYDF